MTVADDLTAKLPLYGPSGIAPQAVNTVQSSKMFFSQIPGNVEHLWPSRRITPTETRLASGNGRASLPGATAGRLSGGGAGRARRVADEIAGARPRQELGGRFAKNWLSKGRAAQISFVFLVRLPPDRAVREGGIQLSFGKLSRSATCAQDRVFCSRYIRHILPSLSRSMI